MKGFVSKEITVGVENKEPNVVSILDDDSDADNWLWIYCARFINDYVLGQRDQTVRAEFLQLFRYFEALCCVTWDTCVFCKQDTNVCLGIDKFKYTIFKGAECKM